MEKETAGQTVDTVMAEPEQTTGAPPAGTEQKATYRSFKKKYRKMRVKFDDDMRKSNDLFLIEQQANATVRRLAQMNNQILEMLLDVNSSPHVTADKRVNLTAQHSTLTPLPPFISSSALTSVTDPALQSSIQANVTARAQKDDTIAETASKSLSTLLSTTPHPSSTNSAHLPPEILADLDPLPLRHLTMDQIDAYLDEMDNATSTNPAPTSTSSAQDVALKNPHSVYNWLRMHEPKVFLQDGEGSEKSSSKPGALRGTGKRGSTGALATPSTAAVKAEHLEPIDDDGTGLDGLGGSETLTPATGKVKGKRKRGTEDDDGGYHPKQGRVDDGKGKKPRKPRVKKGGEGENGATGTPAPKRVRKSAGKSGPAVAEGVGEAIVVKNEDESVES